jgi:hypothetical protein
VFDRDVKACKHDVCCLSKLIVGSFYGRETRILILGVKKSRNSYFDQEIGNQSYGIEI